MHNIALYLRHYDRRIRAYRESGSAGAALRDCKGRFCRRDFCSPTVKRSCNRRHGIALFIGIALAFLATAAKADDQTSNVSENVCDYPGPFSQPTTEITFSWSEAIHVRGHVRKHKPVAQEINPEPVLVNDLDVIAPCEWLGPRVDGIKVLICDGKVYDVVDSNGNHGSFSFKL